MTDRLIRVRFQKNIELMGPTMCIVCNTIKSPTWTNMVLGSLCDDCIKEVVKWSPVKKGEETH